MLRVSLNREAFEIAMTRRNLSRKSLAQKLGFSRCYMSQVANGRKEPSPAMRERLLQYFKDHKFDDLFTIQSERGGNGNGSNTAP
ncbi:MAG: helix-turn-helix transcriptional regulator [Dehalococcoidia bacterium]|nr:helix-turn-helix transcriptional regulator [Dehalococcoidia bacterium]